MILKLRARHIRKHNFYPGHTCPVASALREEFKKKGYDTSMLYISEGIRVVCISRFPVSLGESYDHSHYTIFSNLRDKIVAWFPIKNETVVRRINIPDLEIKPLMSDITVDDLLKSEPKKSIRKKVVRALTSVVNFF